ncbi:MAG TPA: hypothetical protein VMJ10_27540 [Kofleriaceae bacterium]|nr:hypothetical protein [Kofleriaceae bacterium]
MAAEPARVEVDLGFFPLMWILFLITPYLAIDGRAERRPWGKHQLMVPPGTHHFEAWYPYIFRSQTSIGAITLDLLPGASYLLKYRPAWLVFLPGKMTLVEQPMLPVATARQA